MVEQPCVLPLDSTNDRIHNESDFLSDESQDGASFTTISPDWPRRVTLFMPKGNGDSEINLLELHAGFRLVENPLHEYCVVFKFSDVSAELPLAGSPAWNTQADLSLVLGGESQPEQFVLVCLFKLSEEGEWRLNDWVPSVVRLHTLNCCPYRTAQTGDPANGFLSSAIRGIVYNGESQSVFLGGRILPGLMHGDGVDQVIQSRPQVVDAIADNESPILKAGDFGDVEDNVEAGKVLVSLFGDAVRVSISPQHQFTTVRLKVGFGTPKLGFNAG
jgi:hypothetical protein